jgi:sulfite exporter TauE/SafE
MMLNTSSNPLKDTNMIVRNTSLKNDFRVIVGTLFICLHLCIFLGAEIAQAATKCVFFDKFKDNNDGTVTDPRNGLMWTRCAEGFTWTGSACEGIYKKLNWEAAMEAARQSRFLGKSDWRIPSKAEFATVTGRFLDCRLPTT